MSIASALHRLYFSRRFMTFLVFGGTAAAVNLGIGWLIYDRHFVELPYWLAVTVGAAAGLVVNFLLNYYFNFNFRGRSAFAQLRSFIGVSLIGIGLTALISELLHRFIMIKVLAVGPWEVSQEFCCHFISVGAVTFYSYAAHSYLTFNVGFRERGKQILSWRKM
ncbi:MAG TPA: GtrA family protein [Rhizomicrobium sp.]|nr:GtrA family protein [Rhizomicrobium sp.]